MTKARPRLAIVTPFLNSTNGTERIVLEWIGRLTRDYEIHIYTQTVEDLDLATVTLHYVPKLPGPHLFNYVWWFAANHLVRAWDRRVRGRRYEIVFSPGVNCLDADVVSVHIVFAELFRRVGPDLKLTKNPVVRWPLLIHRKVYYRLIMFLERRVFTNPRIRLILTSTRTADELERFYRRKCKTPAILAGLDQVAFNPTRRRALRADSRKQFSLSDGEFVLLLIGNDWRKKGLPSLLDSLTLLRDLPVRLFVVTRENDATQERLVRERELTEAVRFLPPRKDVENYYAAADAYVGPSLEDTFALPAMEAMACGMPVVISARAGASDLVINGENGLILEDPTDSMKLASLIRQLFSDPRLRAQMGTRAAATASQFTWERSSSEVAEVLKDVLRGRGTSSDLSVAQET